MGLEVLYLDNHLLAVNKPAGMPTVPDASREESLLDRARAHVKKEFDKPGAAYLGVVHRLDRPVSGVVLFARTSKAARRLTEAFRSRRVEKVYWGVVAREPEPREGELEQWIRKDPASNKVRASKASTAGARLARTRWRVLAKAGTGRSSRVLVELFPETGRPHQLRVALATLGTPLLGDLKYGAPSPLPDKSIALHARSLLVPHPVRDELLQLESPCPSLSVWRFPLR